MPSQAPSCWMSMNSMLRTPDLWHRSTNHWTRVDSINRGTSEREMAISSSIMTSVHAISRWRRTTAPSPSRIKSMPQVSPEAISLSLHVTVSLSKTVPPSRSRPRNSTAQAKVALSYSKPAPSVTEMLICPPRSASNRARPSTFRWRSLNLENMTPSAQAPLKESLLVPSTCVRQERQEMTAS